jgi:phosphoesterase RecJ-like protein
MKVLGLTPTADEAKILLLGLATDTGFFRHIDENGAETFDAAATLIRAGASPKDAFFQMYGGKTAGSRILLGRTLSRVKLFYGGRLALSTESYEENQKYAPQGRDSESLYQMLQTTEGVEAIAILRQESVDPPRVAIGLRSRDKVDVSAIARVFGGGGHKNASGCAVNGTVKELKPLVLKAFKPVFEPDGR